MKVFINTTEEGKVQTVLYVEPKNKEGWIEVPDFNEPEPREGMYAEMYYRNGKVEFEYKPIPDTTE